MLRVHGLGLILLCAGCSAMDAESATQLGSEDPDVNGEASNPAFGPGDMGAAPPQSGGPLASGSVSQPVPALPPEVEQSFEFELPHAGERYVFAVNPDSDSVAVIDATTLAIDAVEAGDRPTFLQTLAGTDAAVVLNVGSSDATLIRTADGKSSTVNVPVQSGANAIAVAPDGKHAVVYFNADFRGVGATGSYQDISVLFLESGQERSVAMTVGFRPSAVNFSEDSTRAFVVTEDGVSVLDFELIDSEGAHIAPTVALGTDAAESLDVSVTPDGKYALARREGDSQLRLVNLDNGELLLLDLQAELQATALENTALQSTTLQLNVAENPATQTQVFTPQQVAADAGLPDASANLGTEAGADVDATAPVEAGASPGPASEAGTSPLPDAGSSEVDGAAPRPTPPVPLSAAITDVDLAVSGQYALAVVRDQSAVVQVHIPGSFTGEQPVRVFDMGAELVGSVSIAPDAEHALLYTTAVDTHERVSILDMTAGEYEVVRLPKAVATLSISDDSRVAFVVHKKLEGNPDEPGLDPDVVLDRSYGYSVLDLASGFSKLQTTKSAPGPSTLVPDGSNLFVLFNSPQLGLREVHQVNLQSFIVSNLLLGSPPTSVGAVPGSKKVFVGQEHADGRIAFIDWQTGEMESVTGFELNSRIREQ